MEYTEAAKYKNPTEYLKVFFRRRWFLIAPAFLGLVVGIVACFVIPPTYEANTLILVEEEKIINPLIQGLAVSTTAQQRMRNIKEQVLGWHSLVELTRRLNLANNIKNQVQFENLIMDLRRDISVEMRGSNIIRIAYFGKNPEQTKLITKALTDNLVDENLRMQTKETNVAIDFIKGQLDFYKRKIKESEIAIMQEQLKALLIDSTDQHPLVRELRHKIKAAEQELASGEYQVSGGDKMPEKGSAAYLALTQEIDRLIENKQNALSGSVSYAANINESDDSSTAIYKLMLMDKLDVSIARDKDVNERIYNMLLQKLETAKITQRLEASKQGTRYTVLDPPRLPLRPAKPNKPLVIFMGLLLGAGLGIGLVFAREFLDQSFLDIEDAKQTLTLPVLGAISRLTTQDEMDREAEKKKKFITISLASSGALIVVVMLIAFFRR